MLGNFPLTTQATQWYGVGTVVAIVALLSLAGCGFRIALAGKPLLGAAAD